MSFLVIVLFVVIAHLGFRAVHVMSVYQGSMAPVGLICAMARGLMPEEEFKQFEKDMLKQYTFKNALKQTFNYKFSSQDVLDDDTIEKFLAYYVVASSALNYLEENDESFSRAEEVQIALGGRIADPINNLHN